MKYFFFTMAVLSILAFITLSMVGIVWDIQFTQNIGGHMKRAADANTIELAKAEMEIVVENIKKYPDGYTSIFYKTPDEDVGF